MGLQFTGVNAALLRRCSLGTVNVVSGLPRSGTSMMMRMCAAGGLTLLSDGRRGRDDRNPYGYFELEEALTAGGGYPDWLSGAAGNVVKVVTRHLQDLPATHHYKVVLMLRDLDEILRSQADMAQHHTGASWDGQDRQALRRLYATHLRATRRWLAGRPNFEVLEVRYDSVVADAAGQAARVARFLGGDLREADMAAAVDPALNHKGGAVAVAAPAPVPPAARAFDDVRAVIFDLDGVIIDSLPVMRKAYLEAHRVVVGGEAPPFSEYKKHLGRSFPDIMAQMGLPVAMHAVFKAESNRCIDEIRVFDGMREVLERLKHYNFRLMVATGKDTDRATLILDHLGLSAYFDMVIGSDRVPHPKPAPDMAQLALDRFGLEPRQAVFVGDAVADIRCGAGAGTVTAAALWGEADEAALREQNPSAVLAEPRDLLVQLEIAGDD